MTQKTPQQALAAYEELYKNPRTGEYIIDGDEAQVAADLAAAVRANIAKAENGQQGQDGAERPLIDPVAAAARGITTFEPTRIIEARRAGGAILVQLAGTPEEQLQLVDSIRADILERIPGQEKPTGTRLTALIRKTFEDAFNEESEFPSEDSAGPRAAGLAAVFELGRSQQ